MDDQAAHRRPLVALQVGRVHRGHHRPVTLAGQLHAPLEIAGTRAGDRRPVGVLVGRTPRAPRLVRRRRVAAARRDRHRGPGRHRRPPRQDAPRRHAAGVADLRHVGTALGMAAVDADQRAAVGGGHQRAATAPQQLHGLLTADPADQADPQRIAAQPVELALVAGGDQQIAGVLDDQVVGRVVARFPQLVPGAVGVDAEDRSGGRLGRTPPGLAARNRRRRVDHRHRGDLGRHGRHRRGPRRLGQRRRVAAFASRRAGAAGLRDHVEAAAVVETQRSHLLQVGVEQQEGPALGVEPEDPSRRLGADHQPALAVEGHRDDVRGARGVQRRAGPVGGHAVDAPFGIAGGDVDPAGVVGGQRPDVFLVGVEPLAGRARAVDAVDAAVGRGADQHRPVGPRQHGVGLQLRRIVEQRARCRCRRRGTPCRRCRCRGTPIRPGRSPPSRRRARWRRTPGRWSGRASAGRARRRRAARDRPSGSRPASPSARTADPPRASLRRQRTGTEQGRHGA